MTGTQKLHGPGLGGGNIFSQIGRWITLAAVSVAGLFMLFFSAAFALLLIGGILAIAAVAVAFFWIRAKLTGRPFGPKAVMEARMEELRAQMGSQVPPQMNGMFNAAPGSAMADEEGPIIDAHQTPEGWTVER